MTVGVGAFDDPKTPSPSPCGATSPVGRGFSTRGNGMSTDKCKSKLSQFPQKCLGEGVQGESTFSKSTLPLQKNYSIPITLPNKRRSRRRWGGQRL